jgi:hypothetical protein
MTTLTLTVLFICTIGFYLGALFGIAIRPPVHICEGLTYSNVTFMCHITPNQCGCSVVGFGLFWGCIAVGLLVLPIVLLIVLAVLGLFFDVGERCHRAYKTEEEIPLIIVEYTKEQGDL